MNSLSWFLYLADVIGNVQGVLILLSAIFALTTMFWFISKLVFSLNSSDEVARVGAEYFWFAPWCFVMCMFFAAIIPSKQTIYLIAGSEAGETVVTSEAGQEILLDIQEVIQHQLDQLKGSTEKSSDTP